MTAAREVIEQALLPDVPKWTKYADKVLAALTAAGFTPPLPKGEVLGVLDDAEQAVNEACIVRDGKPHPAMQRHYDRDMHDIRMLRAMIAAATEPPA